MNWRRRLDEIFGLDLRSLALYRIAIALVILYDLADRSKDLSAHYTDAGVLPVATLYQFYGDRIYASIHVLASGTFFAEAMVFVLHGVVAVALLLGFRTRVATFLCWYLSVSMQLRVVPFAKMGGDAFVSCTLLFGIFLPLGAYWSWDRLKGRTPPPTANSYVGIASAAYILQISIVYWLTGWLKTGESWMEGRAVWYLLNVEMLTSPIAPWMREQTWMLGPLTYISHGLERYGAFLLYIPWWTAGLRLFAIVAFSALHIGMGTFLFLGPYPIMCISGWLALTPGAFWDRWLPATLQAMGRSTSWIPKATAKEVVRPSGFAWAYEALAAVLALHIAIFSAGTLHLFGIDRTRLPKLQVDVGRALVLNNTWSMMAPDPGSRNWWFIVDGTLASGASMDPFRNRPVSWEKPDNIRESLRSWRWRLFLRRFVSLDPDKPRLPALQESFGDYLCSEWNRDHEGDERLVHGEYAWVLVQIKKTSVARHRRRGTFGRFTCPAI
jgi:hypothetical protein